MKEIKVLKEAWKKMQEDASNIQMSNNIGLVNTTSQSNTQTIQEDLSNSQTAMNIGLVNTTNQKNNQTSIEQQSNDPQIEALKEQIRQLDEKIAPLLKKKRDLEEKIYKSSKE